MAATVASGARRVGASRGGGRGEDCAAVVGPGGCARCRGQRGLGRSRWSAGGCRPCRHGGLPRRWRRQDRQVHGGTDFDQCGRRSRRGIAAGGECLISFLRLQESHAWQKSSSTVDYNGAPSTAAPAGSSAVVVPSAGGLLLAWTRGTAAAAAPALGRSGGGRGRGGEKAAAKRHTQCVLTAPAPGGCLPGQGRCRSVPPSQTPPPLRQSLWHLLGQLAPPQRGKRRRALRASRLPQIRCSTGGSGRSPFSMEGRRSVE